VGGGKQREYCIGFKDYIGISSSGGENACIRYQALRATSNMGVYVHDVKLPVSGERRFE
jgi:hypothetical protein